MVEKLIISPESIRAYGNIVESHSLTDYSTFHSGLAKISESVNGVLSPVYSLVYSLYGLMFGFDDGAKQIYLQAEEEDSFELGFSNKQFYLVNDTDENVDFDFDDINKQLYIMIGD